MSQYQKKISNFRFAFGSLFVGIFVLGTIFYSVDLTSKKTTTTSKAAEPATWGYIEGVVRDATTGQIIENAIVVATGNGSTISKKTNHFGSWGMSFPAQGYYTITVSKSRYVTQTVYSYAGSTASIVMTNLQQSNRNK